MKFQSAATMYRGCVTSWEFDNVRRRAFRNSGAARVKPKRRLAGGLVEAEFSCRS